MKEGRKKAAVCIIENQHGQILLLQRSNMPHGFGIPGGKAEADETMAECAMRELKEETGIVLLLSHVDEVGMVKSAVKEFDVYVFHTKVDEVQVTLSGEHIGYIWTTKAVGIDLAGNTDQMLLLWQNTKQKED